MATEREAGPSAAEFRFDPIVSRELASAPREACSVSARGWDSAFNGGSSDGVHPTAAGYRAMARGVLNVILGEGHPQRDVAALRKPIDQLLR
jgi:hypothetical protein